MVMATQDTVLFNDTIEYNIAYGKPGVGRGEVEEISEAAKIHTSISERFPKVRRRPVPMNNCICGCTSTVERPATPFWL